MRGLHDRIGLPIAVAAAAVGFTLLFTGVVFHFWAQIALTVLLLCALAAAFDPAGARMLVEPPAMGWAKALALGVGSAAVLYGIFCVGNIVAGALFDFARDDVARTYTLARGTDKRIIAALLLLVIGPGEEVFWRGYLQRRLTERFRFGGLVLAVLAYGLVHVGSGNLTLIAASFVCAGFWGLLYWRLRSIHVCIVSHALWDVAVFVLFPFATGG